MTAEKNYELTGETTEWMGYTIDRIRAVRDFDDIKASTIGYLIRVEIIPWYEKVIWLDNNFYARRRRNRIHSEHHPGGLMDILLKEFKNHDLIADVLYDAFYSEAIFDGKAIIYRIF